VPNPNIEQEATKLSQQAELGRPSDLQQVHQELQNDMKNYSASDYGQLLNSMQQQNADAVKANSHLPNLEFYDSGKSGVPDSVKARYADGSLSTPDGQTDSTVGACSPQSANGGPGAPNIGDVVKGVNNSNVYGNAISSNSVGDHGGGSGAIGGGANAGSMPTENVHTPIGPGGSSGAGPGPATSFNVGQPNGG
jgi:hypothetical protein